MIDSRKKDHLRICVEEEVEAGDPGFGFIDLKTKNLPELDYKKIDLSTKFLDHKFQAPIIFEAITGGTEKARKINQTLSKIAEDYGLGFGVGSQRAMIEKPALKETFNVRDVSADVYLIANIGAVQLNYGYSAVECEKAVKEIDANALALHVNPLQEVFQPEGDTDFSNLKQKINEVCDILDVPVILKGVGSGIAASDVEGLDVAAIDVGGLGGTSWPIIECKRSGKNPGEFAYWGHPTVNCLQELSESEKPIIASGGVRTGIDMAKSIALGASMTGIALPLLKAYYREEEKAVAELIEKYLFELKTSMYLTGCETIKKLKDSYYG